MDYDETQRHHAKMREWAKQVAAYMLREMGVKVDVEILVSLAYADYHPRMEEPWHTEDYMRYVLYVQRAYEDMGGLILDVDANKPTPAAER
jgi:hypothetical protein